VVPRGRCDADRDSRSEACASRTPRRGTRRRGRITEGERLKTSRWPESRREALRGSARRPPRRPRYRDGRMPIASCRRSAIATGCSSIATGRLDALPGELATLGSDGVASTSAAGAKRAYRVVERSHRRALRLAGRRIDADDVARRSRPRRDGPRASSEHRVPGMRALGAVVARGGARSGGGNAPHRVDLHVFASGDFRHLLVHGVPRRRSSWPLGDRTRAHGAKGRRPRRPGPRCARGAPRSRRDC
jgi:hypothetical protein